MVIAIISRTVMFAVKYLFIFLFATFSVYYFMSLSPGFEESNPFVGYLGWLWGLINLDPGTSMWVGEKASAYLLGKLGKTIMLSMGAIIVSLLVTWGIIALLLRKKEGMILRTIKAVSYLATAAPVFLLCYMAMLFLDKIHPGLLPTDEKYRGLYYLVGLLILGLGNNSLGEFVRGFSTEMEKILTEPYITAAKARGVSVWKHSIRQILLVTVNMFSSRFILTIGCGVIVVEYIFTINGIGLHMLDAAKHESRDVLLLITVILIGVVCLSYLVSDMVRLLIDRRNIYE